MNYMFLPEAARDMGVPVLLLKNLCEQSRIEGAVRFGRVWMLPESMKQTVAEQQNRQLFNAFHAAAS